MASTMDVTVEQSGPIPSPLGQSFPPSSPTNARKRSFNEVDNASAALVKARDIQYSDHSENQENRAPLECDSMAVDKPITAGSNVPSVITTPLSAPTAVPGDDAIHPQPPSPRAQRSEGSALTALSIADTNMPVTTPSTPQQNAVSSAGNPAKKRKLSPNNKEAKRLEKEEKDRLKLEEKAKKEEEKRTKEEEKKKREAEREEERKKRDEKKKLKEEEKMAKDEERRKKEEEKSRKEKSQMRLSAFFAKPAAPTAAKPSGGSNPASPRKSSTAEVADSTAPDKEPEKVVSDYHKDFPEFFVQSHTTLAPPHRFERDAEATVHIRQKLDGLLKGSNEAAPLPNSFRASELFTIIPYRRRRGRNVVPVKELLRRLQNDANPVDLTGAPAEAKVQPHPLELLKRVRMKILRFGEDVRPPYQGTFTKPVPSTTAVKLCRDPFSRALPDINYDYDSEAEWEEPEEGEDLDSEGEEDASEDGDDDMEGFLDDDEDHQVDGRRRLIAGDLEPVCTGIRWQEESELDPEMQAYRMEIISDTVRYPIDPFSTVYWPKPKAVEQAAAKGSLAPPSVPARSLMRAFAPDAQSHPQPFPAHPPRALTSSESATSGKAKRPFPPDQLPEFKQVVEGSDLTKTGLVEVLKKRFPKVSKDVLKDTLQLVAVRVGAKEADKKWVCK